MRRNGIGRILAIPFDADVALATLDRSKPNGYRNHVVTMSGAQFQAVFAALADPTRREILDLLRVRPRAVGELASNFSTSRPAISKHLKVLRAAGLVLAHRHGTANVCELNARPLRNVSDWLRDYQAFWKHTLRDLRKYAEEAQ